LIRIKGKHPTKDHIVSPANLNYALDVKQLIDPFGRPIDYVRLSVTDRCDLRCHYCMPRGFKDFEEPQDWLTFDEIERVIAAFGRLGVSRIRLTGGEPLVRKNAVELAARLAALPGIEDLSLSTNATRLDKHAQALRNAGVSRINVSLDSLRAARFKAITRGKLAKVLAGLMAARAAGFTPIKINMVAIKGLNDDEIESFARLTTHLPLTIRYIEYMPSGNGEEWKESDMLTIPQIKSHLEHIGKLILIPTGQWDGPAKRFKIDGAIGEIGLIGAVSSHFCEECNRIRLTPDGKIRTCLFSDDEIDVREILRNGGTDQDLKGRLLVALATKPERHHINTHQFKKCQRNMSAIGG